MGLTPLNSSIIAARRDVAVALLSHTMPVNVADNMGMTPLMIAASLGDTAIITALMRQRTIKFSAEDDTGKTALHWAVRMASVWSLLN